MVYGADKRNEMTYHQPTQPDDWKTPESFYQELNERFDFDFDPCPLNHNIQEWDGLVVEWGNRNFVNPPYSRKLKKAFVLKAIQESKKGKLCVLLLPGSTDTKLFHDHILPNAKDIEFIKGRLKFEGFNYDGVFCNMPSRQSSILVIFDGR